MVADDSAMFGVILGAGLCVVLFSYATHGRLSSWLSCESHVIGWWVGGAVVGDRDM